MSPLLLSLAFAGFGPLLGSTLASWIGGRNSNIEIKLGSKRVSLDLDRHLRPEQTDEIVRGVVRSARLGDEAGLRKIVSDSHLASEKARREAVYTDIAAA